MERVESGSNRETHARGAPAGESCAFPQHASLPEHRDVAINSSPRDLLWEILMVLTEIRFDLHAAGVISIRGA